MVVIVERVRKGWDIFEGRTNTVFRQIECGEEKKKYFELTDFGLGLWKDEVAINWDGRIKSGAQFWSY